MRLAWVSFPARLSSAGSPTQTPPCPSSSQSTETRRCFSVPRSSCTQDWESTLCAAGVLTRGVIARDGSGKEQHSALATPMKKLPERHPTRLTL